MKKITIGITFFDRIEYLKSNLNILSKDISNVNILIINDNIHIKLNIFDIVQNIENIENIRIINNSRNMGEYYNFHTLINQCNTDYFTWLADDDLYEKDLLSKILSHVEHNQFDMIVTEYRLKFNDKPLNKYILSLPHVSMLHKNINSVSLYCVYRKNFLIKLIQSIPPFCEAKIALYFEYALILNLYNYKYTYEYIKDSKIIINNSQSSWSASDSNLKFWRDGFTNFLNFVNTNKNLGLLDFIHIYKFLINDQISILIRSQYNVVSGYLSLIIFLLRNTCIVSKRHYYLSFFYIFYSLLFSLKFPILFFKNKLCQKSLLSLL